MIPTATHDPDNQSINLTPYRLDPKIKASVLMLAYNHEPYIWQAVESVLMQKVSFEYEIVIGEDFSNDKTREILIELANHHPQLRLLLRPENLGMHQNVIETLRECRGQYVAFLEGDDYWTSPYKLATQVKLMDAEPDCVLCGHNVALDREDGSIGELIKHPKGRLPARMYLEDMFGSYVQTCSMMLRNGVLKELPAGTIASDKNIQVFIAQYGVVRYIDEVMATYRLHHNSVWNPLPELTKYKASIKRLGEMDEYFEYRYHGKIREAALNYWMAITKYFIQQAVDNGDVDEKFVKLRQEMPPPQINTTFDRSIQVKVMGAYWVNIGFARYRQGRLPEAREFILKAFRIDPVLLANRGAWAVVLKGSIPGYRKRLEKFVA